MNKTIHKQYRLLVLALLASVLLAGCVGTRQGVSWPALDIIELNGEHNIVVSYTDQVNIVNASNGAPARLINPSTGEVRRAENGDPRTWTLLGSDYEGAQFHTNPIPIDDETLLMANYNSQLVEVDLVTATIEQTIPVEDHILADILVDDDILYIPFQNIGVAAMTLEDYEIVWSYPTEEGVWAKPLKVDDLIIFGSLDHHLYAVTADTGELQWRVDLEGGVASTPLLFDGRLYVGSYNKKVFEISLQGEILNSYEAKNWVWSTPAIDDEGIIYVPDLSGYVHALDTRDNLSEVWSVQVATRGIRPSPIIYEDKLIVASRDGVVYWLDRRDGLTINDQEVEGRPELLGELLLLEPSETLDIDEPLIVVSSVNTGELLVAFGVDGRQTWVYRR